MRALAAAAVVGGFLLLPATGGTAQAALTAIPWGQVAPSPFSALSAVSGVTVVADSPSAAEGARAQYRVEFATSATGGLSEDANSRINVTFPTGTTFTGFVNGQVFDTTNTQIGSCFSPSGLTIQCFLATDEVVDPNQTVRLVFNGVTHPAAGDHTLSVSTTSDTDAATSSTYTIVNDNPLTGISVTHGSPSAAEGARAQYRVEFTTSATGGLSDDANSRINVTFPTGTTFNGFVNGLLFDTTNTQIGSCFSPVGLSIQCFLANNEAVDPNQTLRLVFSGVTHPAQGDRTLSVSTTSDTAAVTSPTYTIVNDNPLTGVSVTHGSPSAAEGARAQYRVEFTTSATGGLSDDANSRINVTFPTGTTFNGFVNGQVFDTTNTQIGSCFSPVGLSIQCFLANNEAVDPNQTLRLVFSGVTHPAQGDRTLTVSTTSDTAAVTSPTYTIVNDNPLTGVTLALDSDAPGVTTRWVPRFTTSATGGLSAAANSRITVTFPNGTGLTSVNGQVFDSADDQIGSCFAAVGQVITCFLSNGETVSPNESLRLNFNNVTNPSTPGPYTIQAATTSDTNPVTSGQGTGGDNQPPDTIIDSGPSGTTNDSTPTFTFSSTEANSTFECRVDGAAFSSCSSPHTTAALADGAHTFEVRATDPAGNVDASAASRAFTVTTADTTPPAAAITAGPSGSTDDDTPSFQFNANEPGSSFECSIDGGAFVPCSSPFTTPSLAAGQHTFSVRARDAAGNVGPVSTATFQVEPKQIEDLEPLTNADVGRVAQVAPASGRVLIGVQTAGAARAGASQKGVTFVPLEEAREIPVGSFLDTSRGTVQMVSATGQGNRTQSGKFSQGVFQVLQSRKRRDRGLTQLSLKGGNFKRCGSARGRKASAAGLSRRTIRRLRANARGRFRTGGRNSSATVRGTIWTTTDRCDGTLTQVRRGAVVVRDFRRKRNVVVRAGKSYLARAPR